MFTDEALEECTNLELDPTEIYNLLLKIRKEIKGGDLSDIYRLTNGLNSALD